VAEVADLTQATPLVAVAVVVQVDLEEVHLYL
jgi:hypothetical protein